MKKFFFALFGIYILIVITYFSLRWLFSQNLIPQYSFKNVSLLLPNEFQNKKITTIQYINRTHQAYIFTDTNELYIFDLGSMKKVFHHKLPTQSKIKSIICIENRCFLLTKNSIERLQIENYTGKIMQIQSYLSDTKIQNIDRLVYYRSSALIYQTKNKFISYSTTNKQLPTLHGIEKIEKIGNTLDFEFVDSFFSPMAYYSAFMQINFIIFSDHDKHHITSFLNLHNIKKIAIHDEAFHSHTPKNVIFIDTKDKLYKAMTNTSFFQDIYNFSEPFAYFPMLFIMMFA